MPAPIDLDARHSSPGQSSCYPTSTRSGGGRVTLRASSVFLCMVHVRLTTTRLAAQLVRARVARSSRRTACGEAIVERKRRPACVRPSRHCTPLDKFGQNCSRVLISRRSSPSIDGAARFRSCYLKILRVVEFMPMAMRRGCAPSGDVGAATRAYDSGVTTICCDQDFRQR